MLLPYRTMGSASGVRERGEESSGTGWRFSGVGDLLLKPWLLYGTSCCGRGAGGASVGEEVSLAAACVVSLRKMFLLLRGVWLESGLMGLLLELLLLSKL